MVKQIVFLVMAAMAMGACSTEQNVMEQVRMSDVVNSGCISSFSATESRPEYYKAEKAYMYHYKYSDEQKEKNRIRMLDRMKNDDRLETSIQFTIDNLLFNHQINFEREKVFDYYAVDNYLCDFNGIIEVMGDYWHTTPLIYNANNRLINEMQH